MLTNKYNLNSNMQVRKVFSHESGTLMLEITLSLGFIFILVGGVADISLFLYERSLHNYAMSTVARMAAAELSKPQGTNDCDEITASLKAAAETSLTSSFPEFADADITVSLGESDNIGEWIVNVNSSKPINCGLCKFLSDTSRITNTSTELVVENRDFNCTGGNGI